MSASAAPDFVRARITATRRPARAASSAPAIVESLTARGSGAGLAMVLGLVVLALALAGLADGSVVMAAVMVFSLGVLIAAVWRPRLALYALLGVAIFFEEYNADPLMSAGTFFNRNIQAQFNVPGIQFTLLELLQLFTLVVVLVGNGSRGLEPRGGRLFVPAMLFLGTIGVGIARGMLGGGQINFAIWEARFLVSMIVCYVLAANTLHSRAHIRELLTVIFVIAGMFGIEAVIRRYVFIQSGLLGSAQEVWYSHEDVILWACLMLLVVAQRVFGAPRWQLLLGPILGLAAAYALLISERRAGMISVLVAFLVMTGVLFMANRKAFFLISVPLLICGAVYLPLFWNASGALGQPARAIRSISDPDPRDALSNNWRVLELVNIRATIASDPLTGVGFGRPYLLVVPIPDISFYQLWQYETHHNILWIWLKMGVAGFIVFWCLLGTGMARAAHYARRLRHPELRTFALLSLVGIVSTVVFCYVDLGFAGSRIPFFLGTLLGGLGILDQLELPARFSPLPARLPSLNQ